MDLFDKEAFLSAIKNTKKQVAVLVGSPLSQDIDGKGVPGVDGVLDVARRFVSDNSNSEISRYDSALKDKSGSEAYQTAMRWIQANISQDAVNEVIRISVLKSCTDTNFLKNTDRIATDGSHKNWHITKGSMALASILCNGNKKFQGPILTTNFDPILSMAIESLGKKVTKRVIDTDGSFPRDVECEGTISIIHLHGYWRDSDTLHTATQINSPRPMLKSSLRRFICNKTLIVLAYGGWDDVFTSALADVAQDSQSMLDILWCFHEKEHVAIQDKYKNIFKMFSPAITRGRFRLYGGIDCHAIFSEININDLNCNLSAVGGAKEAVDSSASVGTNSNEFDFIGNYLNNNLEEALKCFSSHPKIWVDRIIKNTSEAVRQDGEKDVNIKELIAVPESSIISAPPQFGLTCLAHYMRKCSWAINKTHWAYVDLKTIKHNLGDFKKSIEAECEILNRKIDNISCIILDSFSAQEKNVQKFVSKVCETYSEYPIIIMQTMEGPQGVGLDCDVANCKKFNKYFLWSLPRNQVRKVVSEYNERSNIGDEDAVTNRLVSDLEVLNLHRTPLNCLTMLKVSEIGFDESPVNRTEVINRLLQLMFNVEDFPTYKTRPDIKDCEYVLGYFCEKIIRGHNQVFSRKHFIQTIEEFCSVQFIDLEVDFLFDILIKNNILICAGNHFRFKNTYWIYYFAAQRMYQSEEFANYIYLDMRYASYPEILEFYTGIDRRREDALKVLIASLRDTCCQVNEKCGLPDGLNPYKFAKWNPSEEAILSMKEEICESVKESRLPDAIKDNYADQNYDVSRPYDQEIRNILKEYSLVLMMQSMSAASRALRNSDYVSPAVKKQLIKEILNCWEQVSKVFYVILPMLAMKGYAAFAGIGFLLCGDFGETPEEKFRKILFSIPQNVVNFCKDDLYSKKMGPLIIEQIKTEERPVIKHKLVILMTKIKPRGWEGIVRSYITSIQKNSFYLYDMFHALKNEYVYGFSSQQDMLELENLIKMAIAKHDTGSKSPGKKLIAKVSDGVIPERLSDK
jgi:hypothetical protein